MDTPAINIQGLTKRYDDPDGTQRTVVDDLDLQIRRGEVFALLGPNGAGKTTTVEILEGYRNRDAGSVQVLDVDPAEGDASWRARIGIVPQTSNETPELTVHEIVKHFAAYYPRPRKVDEVIDLVGLNEKRKSRLRSLSGGQRRRLDVALGIIGGPELLFLDEPTTGFDPQARRSFWGLVRDLATEGTTILLTTHYLDEAENLADRVGVIRAGTLVALDTPNALGGDSQRTVVSWTEPDGVRRSQPTPAPTELITELGRRFNGEVPDLRVIRPSLEDTYLSLIADELKSSTAEALS